MTADGYAVEMQRGPASAFHGRAVPDPARPALWVHEVDRPALVLGSNQDESMVDVAACRRGGIEVVRRRSGGGAVLLVPGDAHWIDVVVPATDPGWVADVHRQMEWVGEGMVDALVSTTGLDRARLAVHHGPMRRTAWSSTICFDGVGAGEVLLDGAKLVGISQRRTRAFARLQCSWYTAYRPAGLVELLVPGRRPPLGELQPVAVLPADATPVTAADVAAALAPVLTR